MKKHSRFALISFTLSMVLFGIFILIITWMIVTILRGVHRLPDFDHVILGMAGFIYVIFMIISIIMNTVVLLKEKGSRTFAVAGLTSQLLVLVLFMVADWNMSKPPTATGAVIAEYGMYQASIIDTTLTDYDSGFRYNVLSDIRFLKKTDTVTAAIGNSFGIRYVVKGSPHGKGVVINIVTLYPSPGLMEPKTKCYALTSNRAFRRTIGETYFTGFTFEYERELVPGYWVFQIWTGNIKLAEKSFVVVKITKK